MLTLLFPECQQRVNGRRAWEAFEAWLSLSGCYASPSGQVAARLDRAFEAAASPRWKSNAASFAFSPCLMFFLSSSFPPCITCMIIFSSCIRLVGSLSDACRSETDCDILCASNPEFPFLLFFSCYFISFLIPFLQLLGGHKISRSPGMFTGQYFKIDAFMWFAGQKTPPTTIELLFSFGQFYVSASIGSTSMRENQKKRSQQTMGVLRMPCQDCRRFLNHLYC